MKKWLIVVLLQMACASPSHALQVLLSGTNATGILDLDIDGTLYDVSFDFEIVGTTPDPLDAFLGDETGAQTAALAIKDALNTTVAITVGTGFSGTGSQSFVVPWSYQDSNCADPGATGVCGWRGANNFVQGTWQIVAGEFDEGVSLEFARFTPSEVPVPPAAILFASGLATFGVLRRRKGGVRIA